MFKIVMIIAVVGLAIAWIIYGVYEHKMRAHEKKYGRGASKRLRQSRSEITDWAQKMAKYQPPKQKAKKGRDDSNQQG